MDDCDEETCVPVQRCGSLMFLGALDNIDNIDKTC